MHFSPFLKPHFSSKSIFLYQFYNNQRIQQHVQCPHSTPALWLPKLGGRYFRSRDIVFLILISHLFYTFMKCVGLAYFTTSFAIYSQWKVADNSLNGVIFRFYGFFSLTPMLEFGTIYGKESIYLFKFKSYIHNHCTYTYICTIVLL